MPNTKLKVKNKKISICEGGFTLVEAMFAIFILTFVIVGLMTVVSSSLYSARYAKQEIIMNFLIQEALDGIRNDRDSSVFLSGEYSWQDFVDKYTGACKEGEGCQIEIGVGGIEEIKPCDRYGSCGKIYLNEVADVPYNHKEAGENTYMRRYIVARKVPQTELFGYTIGGEEEGELQYDVPENNTPELEIEVFVIWEPRNSSLSKERSAKMTLLDWRQQ
ncbi:MAG TPA: type II secretion system protein [Candidatus Paceibacterota bacterium]|nr:type II secretion system protein [Candidatus Paceibacterota bacterium]